jgi:hypothetical protein
LARKSRWFRALPYAASFLFPLFGIIYGALETCRGEAADRRRGKICIALGVASLVLVCVGGVVWMALGLKAGFGFMLPE